MLRPEDLVGIPDFPLASLTVSPSRRTVSRDDEALAVEPRVMQVLVLLARSAGQVVSRQHLFDEIWGGVAVGEDSLNRAIAGVRKALALDSDQLDLETIPRTGYRLNVAEQQTVAGRGPSRRAVLTAAAAATAAAAGAGLWFLDDKEDRDFAAVMQRGRERLAFRDRSLAAVDAFARAAAMRPEDARALGLYAYSQALRTEAAQSTEASVALAEAERATTAAFARDPREPYATLARIILERPMLDFASTEDRLRAVLLGDPGNTEAMFQLWNLLQSTGQSRQALEWVERAVAVDPLAAGNQFPRAQLLWIVGRTAEADRVIDRARQYWPEHPFVRFAQLTILAFTGRPSAALGMLENRATRPQEFTPEALALWRVNLAALDQRTPESVDAARRASVAAARRNLQLARFGILALSALNQIDSAFEIANALFAVGAPASPPGRTGPVRGTAWRFAPWLFTPPVAAMRADPRFGPLCDAAGLIDYWAKRRVRPDYQLA